MLNLVVEDGIKADATLDMIVRLCRRNTTILVTEVLIDSLVNGSVMLLLHRRGSL